MNRYESLCAVSCSLTLAVLVKGMIKCERESTSGVEKEDEFLPRDDDIVAREIKRKGAITLQAVRHIINEVCSEKHSGF